MAHRIIRTGIVIVMVWGLAACSVEPWVKPYERANLADPIMSFSRNPVADRYKDHVYDVREGVRGASGGGGGGCGCN